MAVVADRGADVVEQGGELEQVALGRAEVVLEREAVEQLERQVRDVPRVTHLPVLGLELLEHLEGAAHPQVLGLPRDRDLARVVGEVVGDQPLAHAEVGHRDRVQLQRLEDVEQHHRARHDDLGAHGVEPLQGVALGLAHLLEPARDAAQRLGLEHVAVDRLEQPLPAVLVRELGQRVDRARGAVGAHRPVGRDVGERVARLLAEVTLELRQLAAGGRVVLEEPLGEPQGAERRARDRQQLVLVADRELHAAAADVHHQGRRGVELERALHPQVVEAPLLLGRDHARRDPGGLAGRGDEATRIARLAHRRGGGAEDAVHLATPRQLDEPRQRLDRALHRLGAQAAVAERSAADLHDLALAVHDLEARRAAGARDDHVDRVAADVDGGDVHGGLRGWRRARSRASRRVSAIPRDAGSPSCVTPGSHEFSRP